MVELDRGFHDRSQKDLRLLGVDTPEMFRGSPLEREAGKAARRWVAGWFENAKHVDPGDWPLRIETVKVSKYGDVLARVSAPELNEELNRELLRLGIGRLYMGEKKKPWPEETLRRIATEFG